MQYYYMLVYDLLLLCCDFYRLPPQIHWFECLLQEIQIQNKKIKCYFLSSFLKVQFNILCAVLQDVGSSPGLF